MDKLIPQLYKEYGMYSNYSRALPLSADGLKPVERRVLLSAYLIAKDRFMKSARVDGTCLGKFHPHASSYGTICQLVNQGFLEGQGNFGTNIGVEPSPPAAMRYTECKLAKFTFDIGLKLVDYVNWVPSELDDEPEYFPTMFPFCLMGKEYTSGIGFGYKTTIPCYSVEDLKKRLLYLLKIEKVNPIISPISNCEILSTKEELESLLLTGKGQLRFKGKYIIETIKNKVVLKTFPPGRRFETILQKFSKEMNNQDIGFIDESSGENNGTHITFEVLKTRNRDQIFKSFVKKLDEAMTSTVTFDTVVVDHETKNVKNVSIDEMLLRTYKLYMQINLRMLNENKEKLISAIKEVKLLEKIKKPLTKYLKTELPVDEIIEKISEEIKEEKSSVKDILQKYRITKLLTFKADFDDLNEKLEKINHNIENIDQYVLTQYQQI